MPASLPVPEVVGTWTRAGRRPVMRSMPTTSPMLLPVPGRTAANFARSMALPPPKPMTRSGRSSAATASKELRFGTSGSGTTSPKTVTSPSRPSSSTRATLNASETTRTRRQRRSAAQAPTRPAAPGPEVDGGGRNQEDGAQAGRSWRWFLIGGGRCQSARLGANSMPWRSASSRLRSSAIPVPAMSKAVPWSTEVRTTGRPTVIFTPGLDPHHFDGPMPLIVIHRHHHVEVAARGAEEQRIGGQRAFDQPTLGPGGFDRRNDFFPLPRHGRTGRFRRHGD